MAWLFLQGRDQFHREQAGLWPRRAGWTLCSLGKRTESRQHVSPATVRGPPCPCRRRLHPALVTTKALSSADLMTRADPNMWYDPASVLCHSGGVDLLPGRLPEYSNQNTDICQSRSPDFTAWAKCVLAETSQ